MKRHTHNDARSQEAERIVAFATVETSDELHRLGIECPDPITLSCTSS